MRDEVRALIDLGPLPDEDASEEAIERHGEALLAIKRPLTLEEARALANLFGPDDCYGLAWTLLHLIESAPGWSLADVPAGDDLWLATLRGRLLNALEPLQ